MNRRGLPFAVMALLLLTAAVLLLTGRFSGDDPLQASTARIDPAIWQALETETEVDVLISLRELDGPISEWTTELRRQNTAKVQGRVLSVLTENDFVLAIQYKISAALAGRITKSGMEKLAVHPDVVGINLDAVGSYDV